MDTQLTEPLRVIIENYPSAWWDPTSWVAIVAVVIALSSLRTASKSLDEMRNTERARLLLEIDSRYESQTNLVARRKFARLLNDIQTKVEAEHKGETNDTKRTLVNKAFSKELFDIRETDVDRYLEIMNVIGLWETAGVLQAKGLLDQELFLTLFDSAVVKTVEPVLGHIETRQEEGLVKNPEYMSKTVALYEAAKKHMEQ